MYIIHSFHFFQQTTHFLSFHAKSMTLASLKLLYNFTPQNEIPRFKVKELDCGTRSDLYPQA